MEREIEGDVLKYIERIPRYGDLAVCVLESRVENNSVFRLNRRNFSPNFPFRKFT